MGVCRARCVDGGMGMEYVVGYCVHTAMVMIFVVTVFSWEGMLKAVPIIFRWGWQ